MTDEMAGKVKFGGFGIVAGAVVAMIIGFTWGGWVTATTAEEQTDDALLASRSAICVAQFMNASDYEAQLKAFQDTDSWKRDELIEKGGWAKMPGDETAKRSVARACANGIEAVVAN